MVFPSKKHCVVHPLQEHVMQSPYQQLGKFAESRNSLCAEFIAGGKVINIEG